MWCFQHTWRASRRKRVPPQEAQERLLIYLESSSRTALDSVFAVTAFHII